MTLSLPGEGETLHLKENPGALKSFRFTAGIGGDVVLGATGVVQAVSVPPGMLIHDVHTRVITAFTTAVTLTIGDDAAGGGDVDGYSASATIAPQTAVTTGIYKGMVDVGTAAYAGGHAYLVVDSVTLVNDTIDIVVGGAVVAAGLMEIIITYFECAADS